MKMIQPKFFPANKISYSFLLLLAALFFQACNKKDKLIVIDPAYSQYVDGYTSGIISKTSSIKIKLAADASTTHALGEVVDKSLFDFSPSVKGKASWLDARTIEFDPEENLTPNQLYEVSFNLGKVTKVPEKYKEFRFNIQTVKPSFQVKDFGLRSTGQKDKMFLSGVLETADVEKNEELEKLLAAKQNNNDLKINWQHNGNAKTHSFTVENIGRPSSASQLILSWDGKSMGMDVKGSKTVEVPAVGDFKVLEVMPINDEAQYASILFSDPLAVGQELNGLIVISSQQDITYSINGSEVKLYTGDKLDGNYTISINAGIKNTFGKTLEKGYTANVFFENRMPSVKKIGRAHV